MGVDVAAKLHTATTTDPCCCTAGPCMLEGQYKSGIGTFCGYAEFANASTPPKFYRRKDRTGTTYKADWPVAACPTTPPNDQVYQYTFTVTNFCHTCNGVSICTTTTALVSMRVHNGSKEIRVQFTITNSANWFDGGGNAIVDVWGIKTVGLPFDAQASHSSPGTATSDSGWIGAIDVIQVYSTTKIVCAETGGTGTTTSATINFPTGNTDSMRDVWDRVQEYVQNTHPGAVTTCDLGETEGSERYLEPFGAYPLTTGGTLQGSPPTEADYVGLVTEVLTQTTRTVTGTNACVSLGGGVWAEADGSFEDVLSVEDTSADAIARQEPAQSWTPCPALGVPCSAFQLRAADEVSYRSVQVRATAGKNFDGTVSALTPNTVYRLTIYFSRRAIGATTAPWLPYSTIQIVFNSGSQPTYTTDWFDVPNADDEETITWGCRLQLEP